MPKHLIPAEWLEKPCQFLCHESTVSTCGFCEGEFSFWNGARHCTFCGHLFHRRQCTSKIQVDGMFFRRRICPRCDYYRNVAAEKLKRGEEFVSMNRGGAGCSSSAVFISLSEETAELVLRWRANGVTETVDLLEVKTRKGFSYRGRLNSVGDYDPLRSISLFLGDGFGGQRSFDIRASTAWSAQLWVDGLTAAYYVYQCMLEQNSASDCDTMDSSPHWFNRTKYLPQTVPSNHSSPLSSPTSVTGQPQRYWSTSSTQSDSDNEIPIIGTASINSHKSASVRSRLGYLSERSLTPSTPRKIHHSLPSRYHRSNHVSIKPRLNRSIPSTPGLPYIHSPFSSICRCHAFEILPSRSVDLRLSEIEKKSFTIKPCCSLCRDACKIAVDMDNL